MNETLSHQDTNRRIRLIMDLRNKGVTCADTLGAMERVPRDQFVPPDVRDQAWDDMALPIGLGQTISQPLIVAMMTQALKLTDRDQVLEIGTGCGYQTAVLAHLARRVYTIERHKPLADKAEAQLSALKIRNITALHGDGMQGWPHKVAGEILQFQKIIVTAAAQDKPPQALLDQLAIGGAMVIPIEMEQEQFLKLYRKDAPDQVSVQSICAVRFVPLLPATA